MQIQVRITMLKFCMLETPIHQFADQKIYYQPAKSKALSTIQLLLSGALQEGAELQTCSHV